MSVLSDATANFRVPQKLDVVWTAQNYHDLHDSFVFEAESNVLRNRSDDHKLLVFDRSVRG